MLKILNELAGYWLVKKQWIVSSVNVTDDALHIHGSLLLLFGSAVLLRRRPDNIWSWLFVFGLELFNEYADLYGKTKGEANIPASLHDVYLTMFWPTLILLLGWFFFPRRERTVVPDEALSGDFADQYFEKPPAI
jgi:hypothetical protein